MSSDSYYLGWDDGYKEGYKDAKNEYQPSAQPEPRWIPCSEQLPEKSGQYYVSGGNKVWICEFLIIPNFIRGWCNDVSNPVVQAWMPFPEPYGGESK